MRLLDRYVLLNFAQAYLYCIAGFFSIWLVFDVSDNISTFLDDRISLAIVARYYLTQIPQIVVVLLPVSLLLALLFCLGRMSRANEIVSMLTAGVSVPRLLLPLFLIGFLSAIGSAALNYSLAPHAELARKRVLEDPRSRRSEIGIMGQIFRNRTDNRTWFISWFKLNSNEFNNVQIVQQDARGDIIINYLASNATYVPETKEWLLKFAKEIHYDAAGNVTGQELEPLMTIKGWSETPFRLTSANVRAEYLNVPELRDYLTYNSDFPLTLLAPFATHLHYRLALPWTCLVVALIAAPLGIGYSRRGTLASVAVAIVLIFSMNFLTHLFLALGEGARIAPWMAAWAPNAIFAAVGLILLYFRSTNREPPRLFPFGSSVTIAR